eukprot:CAMPEP_0118871748 /NCGR_PEP_ID=MMETSP1163-20130328/14182_1 /TAXON_ID=124430 /ORGANISM="Phaeomonas parva, Strain CCMP2877" /LENGTH=258 /DNA_ID=CAMNT_0006806877 /DNA_START=92 /DNA_END=868 /DNA_ORIENTATION=-
MAPPTLTLSLGLALTLALLLAPAGAFQLAKPKGVRSCWALEAKKRKKASKKPKANPNPTRGFGAETETDAAPDAAIDFAAGAPAVPEDIPFEDLNAGEQELLKMRQARQAIIDEKEAKINQYVEERAEVRANPRAGVVPDAVSKRMLGRMVPLFGLPFFLGIGVFVGFYFYGQKTGNTMQPSLVAYATQAPFLLGLVGLSYGVLSASWDEEIEGSFLGIEEFQLNVGRIFDGLNSSGERRELEDDILKRERELKNKRD